MPEHRGMVQLFSQGFALREVPFSITGRSSTDAQDKQGLETLGDFTASVQ